MNEEKEGLIAAARAVAERLGVRSLSIATFQHETGINRRTVYGHFQSWPALCKSAGLEAKAQYRRISDEEIFTAMRDHFIKHGRIPTRELFGYESSYGTSTVGRRFGSWTSALAAFRRWANVNAPDFPLMEALNARLGPEDGGGGAAPAPLRTWRSSGGRASGDSFGFRAMVFAPVNEMGVVALFAMTAADLGYRIETVAPGFPDCMARRHVGSGRWESVRVEFEYRSRNFRDHGHDPAGCDVVVCWEHDWPDCPVEVLALREAIAALPAR